MRDSYGKTNFIIGMPRSVANITAERPIDPELDKAMQDLSDSLDKSYDKFDMDSYFTDLTRELEQENDIIHEAHKRKTTTKD